MLKQKAEPQTRAMLQRYLGDDFRDEFMDGDMKEIARRVGAITTTSSPRGKSQSELDDYLR